MSQSVQDNQDMILRFLYHERGDYKSRQDIQDGTGLSEAQVRYALKGIQQYVKKEESDTRGDIPNAYVYHINNDGRAYVRKNIGDIPVEQRNSEELDKHKKEIMLVRASVNELEDTLEEWTEYSTEWNNKAERRLQAIEQRLEILENELLEED
jgi:transcriptional antiterminator